MAGQWQWPAASGGVIAGFNEAGNKGRYRRVVGEPVCAAAAGKVVYVGSGLRGYGKLIVIKHNQEYNSVYAHNDKLLVKEDDQVAQGQKIAELGSSKPTGPSFISRSASRARRSIRPDICPHAEEGEDGRTGQS